MTSVAWLSERDVDITCIRLKPYRLAEPVLIDVAQVFPVPETADYQIRIREKERSQRRARQQNGSRTCFDLTIGERQFPSLSKLRLAYHVVREAVARGTPPRDVVKGSSAWIAVAGKHDRAAFLTLEKDGRDSESSAIGAHCFFTADDELIHWQGKTYALRSNMWGRDTVEILDHIIRKFGLTDVAYTEST